MNISIFYSVLILVAFVKGTWAFNVLGSLDELSLDQQQEARELIPAFRKIEENLGSIHSDDAEVLIHEIRESISKMPSGFLNRFKFDQKEKSKLKKASILFTSLEDISNSCDHNSYKILAQNHLALDMEGGGLDRKSVRVFKEFASRHATYCRPTYEDSNTSLFYKLLESKNWNDIAILEDIFRGMTPNKCLLDPLANEPRISEDCADDLAEQLLPLANINPRKDNFHLVWHEISNMIQSHLVRPCKSHNELAKDVFAPAIYDATLQDQYQRDFIYPERGFFGESLQHFRGCQYILNNTYDLERALMRSISNKVQSS